MNTKDYFDWDENGFDEEHKNRSLPPEYLYYGTTHHQYEQIQRSGYVSHMEKPKIQLTTDIPLEFPKIIKIKAQAMYYDGYDFKKSENNVWEVSNIPLKYVLNCSSKLSSRKSPSGALSVQKHYLKELFDRVRSGPASVFELVSASALRTIAQHNNIKNLMLEFDDTITDISLLAKLENLEVLFLGINDKIKDCSIISQLINLKILVIYNVCSNNIIIIDSDEFLKDLSKLEYSNFINVYIKNKYKDHSYVI